MTAILASGAFSLDHLVELIRATADYPWSQGWFTAVATFFFENVVCWTIVPPLISEGIVSWMVSLQSTFWGVFIGDILMYLPVRFAMRYVSRLKWVQKHQNQIEACSRFFDRHLGKTMFVIRFTPGIRTPALLAAGLLKVHFGLYVLYSALSCALQSAIITFFMPKLYAPVIAWMKSIWDTQAWLVILIIVAFFGAFIFIQSVIAKRVMNHLTKDSGKQSTEDAKQP